MEIKHKAELGQQIEVVFYSGDMATTLSVSGTVIGNVPTPTANNRYKLVFEWDGSNWALSTETISVD